jgi:hypothetical protein
LQRLIVLEAITEEIYYDDIGRNTLFPEGVFHDPDPCIEMRSIGDELATLHAAEDEAKEFGIDTFVSR